MLISKMPIKSEYFRKSKSYANKHTAFARIQQKVSRGHILDGNEFLTNPTVGS